MTALILTRQGWLGRIHRIRIGRHGSGRDIRPARREAGADTVGLALQFPTLSGRPVEHEIVTGDRAVMLVVQGNCWAIADAVKIDGMTSEVERAIL